jgi:hypothetical protein
MSKVFWTHAELPFAKFLNSFRDGLIKDFLKGHESLDDVSDAPYVRPMLGNNEVNLGQYLDYKQKLDTNGVADVTAWKTLPFRYKRREVIDFKLSPEVSARFPTATKIMKHFSEQKCTLGMYSLLAPHTLIKEHTDGEDLEREYIRVHIPLIVPMGDCYFGINNTQVKWDNIWAFDTQESHSAHNNTDHWRLVFIMDLKRSAVGI